MDQKAYNTITAVLFLVIAVLHLLRIIVGWPAQIGGLDIPLWASWLALVDSYEYKLGKPVYSLKSS